jgi:hypothetical protein
LPSYCRRAPATDRPGSSRSPSRLRPARATTRAWRS